MKTSNTWTGKFAKALLLTCAAAVAVITIGSNMKGGDASGPQAPLREVQESPTIPPNFGSSTAPSAVDEPSSQDDAVDGTNETDETSTSDNTETSAITAEEQAVATAAALALSHLSRALVEEEEQLRQIVGTIVAPEKRQEILVYAKLAGEGLARSHGYTSTEDFRLGGRYYISPQMYQVEVLTADRARVWVHAITHLVRADGNTYQDRNTAIISLERHSGEWLYAGWENPPANRLPAHESTSGETAHRVLSTPEEEEAYRPFLVGFKEFQP